MSTRGATDDIPAFPQSVGIDRLSATTVESRLPTGDLASDYRWLSLMSWCPEAEVSVLDGAVVVRFLDYRNPEHHFFGFTGGENPDAAAATLLEIAASAGQSPPALRLVPEATARRLGPMFSVEEDRDSHDYLYDVADSIRMPGKRHRVSRSELARFERRHGGCSTISAHAPDDLDWFEVVELTEKWARNSTDPTAGHELDALVRCVDAIRSHPVGMEVVTTLLRHDQELIGYDITEIMPDGWALDHFRHVAHDLLGAQTKLRQFAAELLHLRGISVWNAEQDLGLEGLRTRKSKYRPVGFSRKYTVTWREAVETGTGAHHEAVV